MKKNNATMTYSEFCEIIKKGIANGEISTSKELNELDLAIQYAIGQEMQERGGEMTTTAAEIYFLIGKHCGKAVRAQLFSKYDD